MVNKYKIIYKKGGNSELFDKIKKNYRLAQLKL